MRKTLAALAAAYALSGCASDDIPISSPLPTPTPIIAQAPAQPTRHSVADYIPSPSTGKLSQAQLPYSIDTMVVGGREYITQSNTHQKEGELEFRLTPYEDATFIHDRTGRTTSVESPTTYVPTRVMIPAGRICDPATEASEISFKPIGAYASRAPPIRKRNPADIETRTRSQDDIEFNLNTTTIRGKEFYVAIKRDDRGNVTNMYFVPVEGSIVGVRQKDRAITLRNPGKIFEIAEVRDYKDRADAPAKSATPEVEAVR